jgi:hypothetical protein
MCAHGTDCLEDISLVVQPERQREEEDSRFVPSPLDMSVRFSHGGSDDEIERELNNINEQAREIESNRPEK